MVELEPDQDIVLSKVYTFLQYGKMVKGRVVSSGTLKECTSVENSINPKTIPTKTKVSKKQLSSTAPLNPVSAKSKVKSKESQQVEQTKKPKKTAKPPAEKLILQADFEEVQIELTALQRFSEEQTTLIDQLKEEKDKLKTTIVSLKKGLEDLHNVYSKLCLLFNLGRPI